MVNEISESVKAKLYDYTYTPFISSFISSWIILNHKYLMVYFSDIKTNEGKLKLLSEYGKNPINGMNIYDPILPFFQILEVGSHFFWYPLGFALFYVYGYPYIANKFYEHTRKMQNRKKAIKLREDNQEPIDPQEAIVIRLENAESMKTINKLKLELSEQGKVNKQECDERVEAALSINKEKLSELDSIKEDYEIELKERKQLEEAYKDLLKKHSELTEKKDYNGLKNQDKFSA